MEVREAVERDTPMCAALLAELGHPSGREGLGSRLAAWSSDPAVRAAVAVDEEDVVGLVAVCIQRNFHRADPIAVVVTLIVTERARRRGVGRALLDDAEAFARSHGCGALHLSSGRSRPEAHAFYRALGFADRCATHARYVRCVPSD